MSGRRVVVTGLGALTSLGIGAEKLWQAIREERGGIGYLTRFDRTAYHAQCAAEVNDYEPSAFFPPHRLKRLDRYAQFSLVVAQEALRHAGLEPAEGAAPDPRFGVSFGTALGGIANAEQQHARFLEKGPDAIPPSLALQVFGGSAHANIAIHYGLRGYATTNSNSCASGTVAVGEAFRAIRDGYADRMVAGAAEAPLAPLTFGAFDAIKAMSKETADPAVACRPFDRRRSGFVMGEGAAAMVLEEREAARARGATIYAEVLGYSLNNDAYHMTSSLPDGASAILAMREALREAGLKPEQVDYVNAHASSTPMNDEHETHALTEVFGSHRPAVSGTKGFYGHPLGATGTIEAVVMALALHHQYVPATLHCQEPDHPGTLDLALAGRAQPLRHALSNSFGFGGINSCLVLGRAE
ncbi:MAG: beta-ketoacyl-[acyl-carrier-protein] synthase family protein [Verrucomicrobium sp.]|nr:beta-ketoacyl-[acyl-carrier-protein] synthase family protein [Verrucomicrobium sp.]